ncbi:OmpW/AlkL family protein [Methylophaga thiooxydans]|uniref:OmpW/AlkL family protein n=1 Tax=Methylophaga thiooxydans TaxID=392484 RepID=UPI002353E361|nr:OmpW family protein [Methylophaga thiooxydans]
MKTTKLATTLLAAIGLSAVTAPAFAYEAGDWLVRGRVITVAPNDDSGRLYTDALSPGAYASIGEGVKVDNDTVPELDITYMITRNWGVELILGFSEHNVDVHKGAETIARGLGMNGSSQVIESKVLPPTLLLQYHFRPNGDVRPYLGAGINYTYFFDEKVPSSSLVAAQGDDIKLDSSWGLAVQAGVDVALNQDWFVNFDVKYIDIDTEAHFDGTAAGRLKINTDIDPFVWGVGIGRRF